VHERRARALGSPIRLLVAESAPELAVEQAWAEICAVLAEVDAAMSRFREDSEITRLHRAHGHRGSISRSLVSALVLADRAMRVTDGRFDARVIVDLERLGATGVPQAWTDAGRAPARLLTLDRRGPLVELLAPADLGGVGKGLALRRARRRAAIALGAAGFLLDAGGDIATHGSIDNGPWAVAVEDPSGDEVPLATIECQPDGAVATSSIRRASWHDPAGRLVHHLIDPRTGEPGGEGLAAVTVAMPDPAWSEIWSKALFLEGAEQIASVARSRDLAAWWVDVDGRLSMTPAARQQTTWVRDEVRRAALAS
jgi:FAD:protein FMN transferase